MQRPLPTTHELTLICETTLYLLEQLLLSVAKQHDGKVVIAAIDGSTRKETDHATQSSIHYHLGIDTEAVTLYC